MLEVGSFSCDIISCLAFSWLVGSVSRLLFYVIAYRPPSPLSLQLSGLLGLGSRLLCLPADPPPSLMAGGHQVNAAALAAHDRAFGVTVVFVLPTPPPRS